VVGKLLKLFVLLAFLGLSQTSQADISEDLSIIRKSNQIKPAKEETAPRSKRHQVNELSLVLTSVIKLYQTLVSSQDVPACNFTKSCSRFSREAVQKYGPFHGIMMASDRLQRCNGFAKKYYPIDPSSGLAIDHPIEKYHLH